MLGQSLATRGEQGYVVTDIAAPLSEPRRPAPRDAAHAADAPPTA